MLINTVGELGARMRDQRRQMGLSQAELARRIGVSRYWIMQLERGNAGAEVGRVLRAVSALNLDIDIRGRGKASGGLPAADAADAWTPDLAAILDRARGQTP